MTEQRINIKLYTKLATTALAKDLVHEYRAWTLLRGFVLSEFGDKNDSTPVHQMSFSDFIERLESIGITKGNFYKVLKKDGLAIFFNVYEDSKVIEFKSLLNVCVALNTIPGREYTIGAKEVVKLNHFKAWCYGGFFGNNKKDKLFISRDKIEIETSVPRSTQIRYEKQLGIEVEENMLVAPENFILPENVAENGAYYYQVDSETGEIVLCFQGVNSYSTIETRKSTTVRKITYRLVDEFGISFPVYKGGSANGKYDKDSSFFIPDDAHVKRIRGTHAIQLDVKETNIYTSNQSNWYQVNNFNVMTNVVGTNQRRSTSMPANLPYRGSKDA